MLRGIHVERPCLQMKLLLPAGCTTVEREGVHVLGGLVSVEMKEPLSQNVDGFLLIWESYKDQCGVGWGGLSDQIIN